MQRFIAFLILCALSLPDAASARVVISEVFWMGSDLSTADEWVEIASDDPPQTVQSLSGWTITSLASNGSEAVIARFGSAHRIQGGSYGVISNYGADASRLAVSSLLISTAMSLPNTKLRLRLRNASGSIVDEVDDGVGAPFAGSNVSGQPKASMERISLSGCGTLASSWLTAIRSQGFDEGAPLLGTPGFGRMDASSSAQSSVSSIQEEPYIEPKIELLNDNQIYPVFLSEVLPNPSGDDALGEWIELRNTGPVPLDLAAWKIGNGSQSYAFPANTVIASGSYLVLARSQTKLTLGNAGGVVSLHNPQGLVIDSLEYGALPEGISAGRLAANAPIMPFCTLTPGAPNESKPPAASIHVQQGAAYGIGSLSLNVEAAFASPSDGAQCQWNFGDGSQSASCNPPSHRYASSGSYLLTLSATDYCSNTLVQTLELFVADSSPDPKSCRPTAFSGVILSEFMPAPLDGEEEWVELYNAGTETASLCGWSVDDGEGGSRPFRLEALSIEPQSFLVLRSHQTGISFNNDRDHIRLAGPLRQGGTGMLLDLQYENAPKGASYIMQDGQLVLSAHPTPGFGNALSGGKNPWDVPHVILRAALPNPSGKDPGLEWIEIENLSGRPQWLNGWRIHSGSAYYPLEGMSLSAGQSRRIYTGKQFSLRNGTGALILRSSDRQVASVLAWNSVSEGQAVTRTELERTPVTVTDLKDGWITVKSDGGSGNLRKVRLAGIEIPRIQGSKNIMNESILALIKDKKFDLYLYSNNEQQDEVFLRSDGRDLAALLLLQGISTASQDAVDTLPELLAYQTEAVKSRTGVWADASFRESTLALQADWKIISQAKTKKYALSIVAKSGIVSSGSVVTLSASIPSRIFLSVNDAPFAESSGSILINRDSRMRAYAIPLLAYSRAEEEIQTSVERRTFLLAQASYTQELRLSEIYPSPPKGEQEWLELYNPSSEPLSLGGWQLSADDGKPKVLPFEMTIAAGEYRVLTSLITRLRLKNDGGQVTLLSPDGKVVQRVRYPKIKTGYAYALDANGNCVSTKSSPMSSNICVAEVKKQKKAAAKKPKTTKAKTESASSISEEDKELFSDLQDQLLTNTSDKSSNGLKGFIVAIWVILFGLVCAACVGSFILLRKARLECL